MQAMNIARAHSKNLPIRRINGGIMYAAEGISPIYPMKARARQYEKIQRVALTSQKNNRHDTGKDTCVWENDGDSGGGQAPTKLSASIWPSKHVDLCSHNRSLRGWNEHRLQHPRRKGNPHSGSDMQANQHRGNNCECCASSYGEVSHVSIASVWRSAGGLECEVMESSVV